MNKNMMFLLAAVGAMLVMSKKARAATSTAALPGASPVANNVNNQLWSKVLGGAWKALVANGTNTDGTPFLMRNDLGQVVTSDGKPVESVYADMTGALSGGVDTTEASGGVDYLGQMGW
jgi:hypothetical protein